MPEQAVANKGEAYKFGLEDSGAAVQAFLDEAAKEAAAKQGAPATPALAPAPPPPAPAAEGSPSAVSAAAAAAAGGEEGVGEGGAAGPGAGGIVTGPAVPPVAAHAHGSRPQPPMGGWKLSGYMGPKQMVATHLAHAKWSDKVPPIAAFYSYACAERV